MPYKIIFFNISFIKFMMNLSLKNKTALVGGSTQGIGKAIAIQLAENGANIVLLARNEAKLIETLSELKNTEGVSHKYIVADFSDFDNFKKTITDFFKEHTVDIVINNTGGPPAGAAMDKSLDDFQRTFDMHLLANHFLAQQAVEGMKKNGWGRIINILSSTIKQPKTNMMLSNSIRAAVANWAKTLASELAPFGITVNNVLPGYIATERLTELSLFKSSLSKKDLAEIEKEMLTEIPIGRLGKPEEMAYAVAFLCSHMADYITGINLPVDGGVLKSL
jgi:3-oxoacyl-[acyl-carrier protein] reductase